MCIERNRHILFCGWAKKLYLAIGRQVQRHATYPAKSYYTCHTHHSGFSSSGDNASQRWECQSEFFLQQKPRQRRWRVTSYDGLSAATLFPSLFG